MKTAPTLASRRMLGAFALALAVAALSASAARADETLRWKFTKGQTLKYVFKQNTVTKSEIMGQKVEFTMNQTMDLTWTIKDVDGDGAASMDQSIDRIVYSMKGGPGGEVALDTSKDEKVEGPLAPMAPIFKALTSSPFRLKMNARGEVSDVRIPEKVVEALKSAGPAAAGNEMFSEKGLKELTGQATIVLPKEPVAKGFQWNTTKSLNLPFGSMNLDNGYTYEGPTDSLEKIRVDVKMEIKPADNSPFEINIAKQDNKGAFYFDNKNGVLRSSDVSQKLQMKIKIMKQEIVQNVETTVTMEPPKSSTAK